MITDQKTIDALKELNYTQVYEKGKEDGRQEILDRLEERAKGNSPDSNNLLGFKALILNEILIMRKEQLNQPKTEGCGKMFQPFGNQTDSFFIDETSWRCGDLWNEKPLLCPECREKENSKP